jgi:butyryl-CoA dehydrogenase
MALAISEPDAGSAATDMTTWARVQGGQVVLNGVKRWSSGAGHAELYLVYCRLSDAPGAKGIGAVVVEKDTPGFTFSERHMHMGFRGVASADMYFDDCHVPAENVIVPAGSFSRLFQAFSIERLGNATMSVAICQAALDHAARYVQEREQFGRPVIDFQAVQMALADMVMRTSAARLLLWQAASGAGHGAPKAIEASIAKCFANEAARFVSDAGLQLFGGYGYSSEYPMERYFRDAVGWSIAGGTTTMQRTRIASEYVGRRFDQRRG